MQSEARAIAYGLAAVLCWSTVATAFKIALQYQSVPQLILIACSTSFLFLACLLAWQRRLLSTVIDLKYHWRKALLFGAISPVLYYCVLLSAYELLPAQVAQPINYTWAIVLALMAVPFLGQRLRQTDFLALCICYTGVVIISFGASSSDQSATVKGVGLALLSTVIWAGYWILNSRDEREPTSALLQNFLCALPLSIVLFWLSADGSFMFAENSMLTENQWTWQAILAGAYIGVFEMGLAFVCWLQAMKATNNTSRISNLIFLSPFISLIFISVILDEQIHALTYLGLALILTGIYIQNKNAE